MLAQPGGVHGHEGVIQTPFVGRGMSDELALDEVGAGMRMAGMVMGIGARVAAGRTVRI